MKTSTIDDPETDYKSPIFLCACGRKDFHRGKENPRANGDPRNIVLRRTAGLLAHHWIVPLTIQTAVLIETLTDL